MHPFLGSRRVIDLRAEGQASREGVKGTAAGREQQWETKNSHELYPTTDLCSPVLRTSGMCSSHWGSAEGMQPALHIAPTCCHLPHHLLQEVCKDSAHWMHPCLNILDSCWTICVSLENEHLQHSSLHAKRRLHTVPHLMGALFQCFYVVE